MEKKPLSDIKEKFPTLEDLMLKNKSAINKDKKKKSLKKYNEFLKEKNSRNE